MITTPQDYAKKLISNIFEMKEERDFDPSLIPIFNIIEVGGKAFSDEYQSKFLTFEEFITLTGIENVEKDDICHFVDETVYFICNEIYKSLHKYKDPTWQEAMIRIMYFSIISYNLFGKYEKCLLIYEELCKECNEPFEMAFKIARILDK